MNLELLKKNIVVVPVIIAVLSGTVASVRYVLNLTNTINDNQQEMINLRRDLGVANDRIGTANSEIANIKGTIEISREIIEMMSRQLNDLSWDVKDLSR